MNQNLKEKYHIFFGTKFIRKGLNALQKNPVEFLL